MWVSIGKYLVQIFIFPLIDKAWDWGDAWLKSLTAKKAAQKEAKAAKEKMDKAQTAKEIDDAADDTLNNI